MEVVVAAESKMREDLALLQTFSFIIEYEAIADSGEIYARHVPCDPSRRWTKRTFAETRNHLV